MAIERTIPTVKSDVVAKNIIGQVYSRSEQNDLHTVAAKMKHLSAREAQDPYVVHKECPFYVDLVASMTSGPAMIQVLEDENAVAKNRELTGATDPANAALSTIRADLIEPLGINMVYGSNSLENVVIEISYFFSQNEICLRRRCGRTTVNRQGRLKRECSGG